MIRFVLILWMLCDFGLTAAFAYGYDGDLKSKSWGYQPVCGTTAALPDCRFHTTSMYIDSLGGSESNPLMGPRKTGSWDTEGDPIGVATPTITLPVGDTPWCFLLLLAAGFTAFRLRRRHKA